MPLDDIGFMWPFNIPTGYRNQRHDHTTMADGGKGTRLDAMIDDDGPLPDHNPDRNNEESAKLFARKMFTVTKKTRFGGTGLYHGDEEDKKE